MEWYNGKYKYVFPAYQMESNISKNEEIYNAKISGGPCSFEVGKFDNLKDAQIACCKQAIKDSMEIVELYSKELKRLIMEN